jgi:carboxypeptidase C (cathepsin A)
MVTSLPLFRRASLVLAVSAFALAGFARADDPPQPRAETTAPAGQKGGRGGGAQNSPSAAEPHRLPSDSTTKQTLDLPGRTLNFAATAGSIRVFDGKGEPLADIATTSYELDGADRATRPVTFLFNGGPGASSAWLQFGAAGPWRLPLDGEALSPSASPR